MPPKRPAHVTRTQTGKIRRRVTAAAGAPPAEAVHEPPREAAPEPLARRPSREAAPRPSREAAGRSSREAAHRTTREAAPIVGQTDVMADAIAAAVMRQLEQSGRLLPPPVAQADPSVPSPAVAQAAPDVSSDDSDMDDVDATLSGLLGGELYTPLPSYHVIKRPLGASLPESMKCKIRRGEYVNLQLLLVDNDDDDDDNMYEQQHQRLTLQVGRQDTLSLLKPSNQKAIKTIDQWVTAFTIYGAVLTETSPHLAPGVFKHLADITEMARRFGGLAWYHYDKSYRKEMGANHLSYGQVNLDLRFRCLERTSNRPGGYSFRGTNTRNSYVRGRASFPLSNTFQKGQCYHFEQFGSCTKPTCLFKHTCTKCSGKHSTSRCTMRSARPQAAARPGAVRPPHIN